MRTLFGAGAHITGQGTRHGSALNFPRVLHSLAHQVRPSGCGSFCEEPSWEGVDSVCCSGNASGKILLLTAELDGAQNQTHYLLGPQAP